MARKKISKNNSNSYWMKFGGAPRKMDKGGPTHPHPHPKNATAEQKRGAQLWVTHKNLDKNKTYDWSGYEGTAASDIAAFKNTRWFDFFPDTSKNVPQTLSELKKYEEAIDAHKSRTIELYDTKFDDVSDLLYATSTGLYATGAAMPAFTPHTALGKGILMAASLVPTGLKAGWDWYKRDWNTKTKKANPGAIFVNPSGDILNYEDNEYSLFNSFLYDRGVKEVREMPSVEELEKLDINRDENKELETDPLLQKEKKNFGGGTQSSPIWAGELSDLPNMSDGSDQNDPTFKMWFAKNAKREDVMQAGGNLSQLKSIFLNDINFPGNNMPIFSNEINEYGEIDKSKRSMDLSELMIGGMQKYGGMPKAESGIHIKPENRGKFTNWASSRGMNVTEASNRVMSNKGNYSPEVVKMANFAKNARGWAKYGLPKAELGMGQGLYKSPTDGHLSDYSGSDHRMDNFAMKMGEVGDSDFMKVFNYVVPGLGTVLDIGMDYWGYTGEKEAHHDLQKDAMKSRDDLLLLNKKDANKETLDLSTRLGALTHKASYNKEGPDFWEDFGNEAVGDVVGAVAGGNDFGLGDLFSGGGGSVDTGGIGAEDLSGTLTDSVKYGGKRKAKGGGHMYLESGMDLKDLHKAGMGGANQFQPGLTAAMINGEVNPLSHDQQFKASGIEQAFAAGGNTQQTDQYEAEGGEVIMHGPGEVPVTTGETEQIDGGTNDAMLSMLEGKSHDQADASGQTGEVVEGEGNQYVFSKSLKSKVWETNFADAAEKIGKNIARFKKEAEKGDGITQTTAMSMIDAWNKKLTDLQQEQEKARQAKFMEMVQEGGTPEQLQEAFPDLFQQFMQEQQGQALSASASDMGGQAQMAANPMGDIDMSQLSAEEQQLVGAQYGLPNKEFGDPFEAYDFNRYFGELQSEGMFEGIDQGNFDLGNDYFAKKRGLMDFLEMNYPDEGYTFGEDDQGNPMTYTSAKDLYGAMETDFGSRRNTFLEGLNTSTTRPDQDDYMKTIQQLNPKTNEMEESWDWATETSQADYKGDKARWKLYNSGLPGNWDENYGRDADISRRKYFKTLETQLLADGKSKEEIKSIIKREKLKLEEQMNLEAIEKENAPLTDEEKAAALAKKLKREEMGKKGKEFLSQSLKDLATLAPTLYNMKKGKEGAEVEPFVENENEALIKENLARLTNTDITLALKENEDNFNQLKYLARDASDGSSGQMMNTLIRGQNLQNEADAKLFAGKTKADQLGLKIANESLYNLGEKDRVEGVRVNTANAKNRAAVEAFKAKGWEGLSGFTQLKEQMANQASRDEQLKGLLNQIYPDAHLYIDREGNMDINKLIESGELDKLMKENPKLAEIFMNYFKDDKEKVE